MSRLSDLDIVIREEKQNMRLTPRGEGVVWLVVGFWLLFYLAVANVVAWPIPEFDSFTQFAVVCFALFRVSRWV
jgi:hypothetical protein